MYRNLEAEMARIGVTKVDIAKLLGVRYATVIDKTTGKSRFYLEEALKIKNHFFPGHSLEYLFSANKTASLFKRDQLDLPDCVRGGRQKIQGG